MAINFLFLSNQSVYSEEKEVNFFCKSDFRNGKNYSLDLLKKKISEGLNINDKCTETSGNGLDYILMNIKKPEALDLLIKSGAIFNKKSNQYAWMLKASPLHLAARGHLPETIPFLIKNGFKINKKDKDGNTPMHYACMKANVKINFVLILVILQYNYLIYDECLNDDFMIHTLQLKNAYTRNTSRKNNYIGFSYQINKMSHSWSSNSIYLKGYKEKLLKLKVEIEELLNKVFHPQKLFNEDLIKNPTIKKETRKYL